MELLYPEIFDLSVGMLLLGKLDNSNTFSHGDVVSLTTLQMVFLNAIFLTGLGMILFLNGNVIRQINDAIFDIDVPAFYALEFAGAFLATLFWVRIYYVYQALYHR